jgi:pimeloyl-ACP methyl ester carboxylesterase
MLRVGSRPLALAYRARAAAPGNEGPGVIWLGGFKSDMRSTKAERLDAWAAANGRSFLRFDYSGHGESEGDFESGTIGRWSRESLDMLLALSAGPQILVGSSMGGWLALLVARALAEQGESGRLAGLVLIAPAVDFTEALLWARLPEAAKREIETQGRWMRASEYGPEPYPITRGLIEDGRKHLLLGGAIAVGCPVHILQGMRDPDVPWRHALTLVEHLADDPATLTLVKDGDHRLSRDCDLERLVAAVEGIA